ncbi:MAG TPA: amidohydrolase family protein [Tepidisphaeraceae bacterium]|jgi:predicted TIM-barrel fold metal-dependent hydrolase|nr:amidohydrolase family protein [Tepidisphaeraceae bacterium]
MNDDHPHTSPGTFELGLPTRALGLPTRRRFLQTAATVAAMASAKVQAAPSPLANGGEEALPILDTHVHLWDLSKFKLTWIEKGSGLDRTFLPADYRKAAEGLNVVKGVYMEVDVAPDQRADEAKYVLDLCREKDAFLAGAVIGGDVASDRFANYLLPFKDDPHLKGVRQITPDFLMPAFIRGVRLLGAHGLHFDLHPGGHRLDDAAKLVDACPDTHFILDHCGNADAQEKDRALWQRGIETIAKRKNVVAKISGVVATAAEKWSADDLAPIINHVLDTFGPDRVMFAGDWPVCTRRATLGQWVNALKQIVGGRGLEERRKLFHDNAVKTYGL